MTDTPPISTTPPSGAASIAAIILAAVSAVVSGGSDSARPKQEADKRESDSRDDKSKKGPPSATLKRARWETNDEGMARRLAYYSKGKVIYCPALGWLVWDGARFQACDEKDTYARREVMLISAKIKKQEYSALMEDGFNDQEQILAEEGFYKDARKKMLARTSRLWSQAIALGNNSKQVSVLRVGQSMAKFYTDFDVLDNAPGLFNTPRNKDGIGGILSLPLTSPAPIEDKGERDLAWHREMLTLTPRPAKVTDIITRVGNAGYDTASYEEDEDLAPLWRGHLNKVMPDKAMQGLLQRIYGSMLVDFNPRNKWFILRGPGGDGKSTTQRAIEYVLGDYAVTADVKTFMADPRANASGPRNDIMALAGGTRMVTLSEPSAQQELDGTLIKQISGGEALSARGNHAAQTVFKPQFKFILICNPFPKVKTNDDGFWRRPIVVPFSQQFKDDEVDTAIDDKLKAEAAGILQWMIEGFYDWRSRGFRYDPPDQAQTAKASFRSRADLMGAWITSQIKWGGWYDRPAMKAEDPDLWKVFNDPHHEGHAEAVTRAQQHYWTDDPNVCKPPRYIPVADIYTDFSAWVEAGGDEPWQKRTFAPKFTEIAEDKGCVRGISGGERYWTGFDFAAGQVMTAKTPEDDGDYPHNFSM